MFKLKFYLASFISLIFGKLITSKKKNIFLIYHSVHRVKKLTTSRIESINYKKFEEQCFFIHKNYFPKIKNVYDNFANSDSISITFDDGKKEIISDILPVIAKYKIPIVVFISPDLVGAKSYLDLNDIKILNKSGLVKFGAHGFRHIAYKEIPTSEFINDINQLKEWFYKIFGFECRLYSHPYGSYSQEMTKLLRDKNLFDYVFCSNFTTFDIKNFDKLLVPRVQIWDYDDLNTFQDKLNGKWNWAKKFINYG